MTTDIRVRTNGNYIAEGKLTVRERSPNLGEGAVIEETDVLVSGVGNDGPVEKQFYVRHDAEVSLHLTERQATEEEVAAGKQG